MTNKEKSIKLYNDGIEIKDIAVELGVTIQCISGHLTGVKKRPKKKVQVQDIINLVEKRFTVQQICDKLNISQRAYYDNMKDTNNAVTYSELIKEKIINLYNQGVKPRKIAKQLSVSVSTVFYKIRGLERVNKKIVNKEDIELLLSKGRTVRQICKELDIHIRTYYNHIKGNNFKTGSKELDQKVVNEMIRLRGNGLTVDEVASRVGMSTPTVVKYTKHLGVRSAPAKKVKVNKPKAITMKKAKQIIPLEISRDNLQKGLEKGVQYIETTLSDNRDMGRLVKIKYSTIGNIPSKFLEIRVKDDVSDIVACERFAKRNNFKSWAVV